MELRTKPFIQSIGVDHFNSFDHNQVQVLSYSNYSLLFLPAVRIEPATSRWFYLEFH